MQVKLRRTISVLLVLVFALGLLPTAFADDTILRKKDTLMNNLRDSKSLSEVHQLGSVTLVETPALSRTQIETLSQWVEYNAEAEQFHIKSGAIQSVGRENYKLLQKCVTATNRNLRAIDTDDKQVSVITPEHENRLELQKRKKYIEGVTKIEFHWWGATIYLSKTTVTTIGTGVTIAGVVVPEPVVSKLLAVAGVIETQCPGGIAFDYNYIVAGINALLPNSIIRFSAISNLRWQ